MPKTKEQKKQSLEELKDNIAKQKIVMFVDFTGLKMEDISGLKKNLKKVDGQLKIAKKTIIQLALKEKGLKADVRNLEGEIALVFGYKDEIAPAKAVYDISKENQNLKILGGFFENEFKTAEEFIALAQLPSKEQLLARVAGSMFSPVTNFVRALQYNIKGLINVLVKAKT